MALPYDYARCTGTTHAACQVCRRREPGREHWQPYMNNPPINMLTGQDRADMLAFGRACMLVERDRCLKIVDNWIPYAETVMDEIKE